jgi:hypothetical protein
MEKFNLSIIAPATPILHKVTGKPIGRSTEAKVMYTMTRAASSVSAAVAATRAEIDGSGFIVVQSSQVDKPKPPVIKAQGLLWFPDDPVIEPVANPILAAAE